MMKKTWIGLFVAIVLLGVYYGYNNQKLADLTKSPQKTQLTQALVTQSKPSKIENTQSNTSQEKSPKVKTTLAIDDPLLNCSTSQYVCEKAVLPPKQEFSYSNYIWANAGETLSFGVTSNIGNTDLGIWIESEDGTFSSEVTMVQPIGKNDFTLVAPFDGDFRVVLQSNKPKNQTQVIDAYVKDPWS